MFDKEAILVQALDFYIEYAGQFSGDIQTCFSTLKLI